MRSCDARHIECQPRGPKLNLKPLAGAPTDYAPMEVLLLLLDEIDDLFFMLRRRVRS